MMVEERMFPERASFGLRREEDLILRFLGEKKRIRTLHRKKVRGCRGVKNATR
jgi:hypothetical protein